MMLPKSIGDIQCKLTCKFRIVVGRHEAVGAKLWDIGEGIADEYPSRQSRRLTLGLLGHLDALTVQPRFSDQLIASHQSRYENPGRNRNHFPVDHIDEQPRRSRTGLIEIDMGIGVISDNRIGMLEHSTCRDPVEI